MEFADCSLKVRDNVRAVVSSFNNHLGWGKLSARWVTHLHTQSKYKYNRNRV